MRFIEPRKQSKAYKKIKKKKRRKIKENTRKKKKKDTLNSPSKPSSMFLNTRNPLATNQALYLSILSYVFSLTLKTHLHPIAFLPSGNETNDHVPFF